MLLPQGKPISRSSVTLHLFSFASGSLALIYEILWMRRASFLFGATAQAAAATLAAFFLGLAAGTAVLGKYCATWRRPLRAYGLLEIGVGGGALIAECIFRLCDSSYTFIYASISNSPSLFLACKVGLAMAAIFIPTFLMGGVLPVLVQASSSDRGHLGVTGGGLYSINTLGATLGALAVPFALLPGIGADWGYAANVAGSMGIGGLAWWLDPGPASRDREGVRAERPDPVVGKAVNPVWTPALLAGFSGLLVLALEVLSSRMLALVHENSVFSFAVVVALFLSGLAAGAALARQFLLRRYRAWSGLAAAWMGCGLLILAAPRLFIRLTSGMNYMDGASGSLPGWRALSIFIPVMLPAVLLAGGILPLLMELAGRDAGVQAGPVLGRMLAVNTVGSILGPLLAGFVMNRLIGLWWSLALIGMLMFILGALSLHLHALRSVPASRRFLLYAVLTACFWLLNPAGLPRVRFDADKGERVAFLKEGSYGTVAVLQDEDHRWMLINNHYVLGGTVSASEERQQGHIPLFLHPSPRDVAFLGMGTGITAGAALLHPVRSVVVLELVPEVIDAAKAHFADVNFNLASDARVEIRAEDARNFLKGSSRRFDVIVGDLVVPWRPGESSLFSLQHFRATREALLPGGIFCQWLPLFQLSEGGFRIIAATFLEVYPRAMLWRGDFLAGQPAVALIGARDPAPLDPSSIDGRLRELAPRLKDLNPYLADPAGFWLFLIGPLDSSDPHYSGARRNEDGRPWLELLAPGGSGGSSGSDALRHARFEAELFEEVKARTLGGSPLERLDDLHLAWRGAGAGLWQASMLAAAGNDQAAQSQAMSILSTLPAPLQSSLLKR